MPYCGCDRYCRAASINHHTIPSHPPPQPTNRRLLTKKRNFHQINFCSPPTRRRLRPYLMHPQYPIRVPQIHKCRVRTKHYSRRRSPPQRTFSPLQPPNCGLLHCDRNYCRTVCMPCVHLITSLGDEDQVAQKRRGTC